jgi:hypothetical protein
MLLVKKKLKRVGITFFSSKTRPAVEVGLNAQYQGMRFWLSAKNMCHAQCVAAVIQTLMP